MAAFFCTLAAVYSFWIIPLKQKAAAWHFWLTAAGIILFSSGFYALSTLIKGGGLKEESIATTVVAIGWLTSVALILVAQGIFVTNFVFGIMRLRHRG